MNTNNWFEKIVITLILMSVISACSPQSGDKPQQEIEQTSNTTPAAEVAIAAPISELVVNFADGTCHLDGPAKLTPGRVTVTLNVTDDDKEGYSASFVTLPSDKTLDDLVTASQGPNASKPDWADEVLFDYTGPVSVKTANMSVATGPIYMVCFSWNDTLNQPRYLIGYTGPIEVDS